MSDTSLAQLVSDPSKRPQIIADCVTLIDNEVKEKSGLSGLAIKGAYSVVKAVKKNIINEAVDHLLDGFITQLQPFYDAFKSAGASGASFESDLAKDPAAVAEALLKITDDRARRAQNATLKKAYEKLRPSAKDHVQTAVPGIGRVIDKHR